MAIRIDFVESIMSNQWLKGFQGRSLVCSKSGNILPRRDGPFLESTVFLTIGQFQTYRLTRA